MNGEASSTAACVNIFNGEVPTVPTKFVPTKLQELHLWKHILGNQVDDEPRSRAWCKRALLRIYANQERDEQQFATVTQRNGVGFVPADARLLSSLAERVIANRRLSPGQWEILYKVLPKYARQLQRGVE